MSARALCRSLWFSLPCLLLAWSFSPVADAQVQLLPGFQVAVVPLSPMDDQTRVDDLTTTLLVIVRAQQEHFRAHGRFASTPENLPVLQPRAGILINLAAGPDWIVLAGSDETGAAVQVLVWRQGAQVLTGQFGP